MRYCARDVHRMTKCMSVQRVVVLVVINDMPISETVDFRHLRIYCSRLGDQPGNRTVVNT
jgi:hypothetical protein